LETWQALAKQTIRPIIATVEGKLKKVFDEF
jgi:hypothetical protein